ncbi:hypothetical protein VNO78_15746 [Psophocarpus tetragonolobus]|uniref:Uncharacterized protein n=1 Tax=Psophocarpus tetragonolobus TaxID=3891 RepID=A0AAN9SJC7_PSOTE
MKGQKKEGALLASSALLLGRGIQILQMFGLWKVERPKLLKSIIYDGQFCSHSSRVINGDHTDNSVNRLEA